jgi:hypothetical protein
VLRFVRIVATYEKVGLTPRYSRALHLSIFEQPQCFLFSKFLFYARREALIFNIFKNDIKVNFSAGGYAEGVVGVCNINIDLYKHCWNSIYD